MLAVAMDSRTPSFRKAMDPRYKATRPPPPPDLRQQMKRCEEVVRAYNIPVFQEDGLEADDLIAAVVDRATKEGVTRRHRQRRQGPDAARPRRRRAGGHVGLDARQGLRPEGGRREDGRSAQPGARSARPHRRQLGQRPGSAQCGTEDGHRSPPRARHPRRRLPEPRGHQARQAEGGPREQRGRRAPLAEARDPQARRRRRLGSGTPPLRGRATRRIFAASSSSSISPACSVSSRRPRRSRAARARSPPPRTSRPW